jgi:hypothetical protein
LKSHSKDDNHQIVSDYFHLINKKDMHRLLNLFTDDCVIFEPFSKKQRQPYDNGRDNIYLKGKSEIESFFYIVMMASDGLQYHIEFIDKAIDMNYDAPNGIFYSPSSSIVSVLVTFYGKREGCELKERLKFHVVPRKNYVSANTKKNDYHNSKEIKILWIRFCSPESAN